MRKILIIVGGFGKSNMAFNYRLREASAGKWDLDFCTYKHLSISISINPTQFNIAYKGKPLEEYDYIYVRNWINYDQEVASAIAIYCVYKGIPFDDEQLAHERHDGKIFQTVFFGINDINVPRSLFVSTGDLPGKFQAIKSKLGIPFIMKNSKLNRGKENYLVRTEEQFNSIVEGIDLASTIICQEYIENSFEYRYLVFGGKTSLVIKRSRADVDKTHKNNASGMLEEFITDESRWQYRAEAEKIAALIKRDVLGIDFLIPSSGEGYYVLEANPAPGMTVRNEGSKIKVDKFVEYVEQQISLKAQ